MKRNAVYLLSVCLLLLPLAGCKSLSHPEYELMVTLAPGVTGTPASGVHTYIDLEEVAYKYTPVNSQHTVEVMIDDEHEDAESTLIIYHDTVLVARLFDARGSWKVTAIDDANSNSVEFTITFSGSDILGGTFSDSRGYHGTWDGIDGTFNFRYSDFEAFAYTGTCHDMSGTYANGSATGTWSATKVGE
ncbi:MAG: hypothetical protein PHX05_04035 [Acidobacteriota bacterium]|nr:hypothetical protein [Acidobacteriota bacterium]